MLVKDLNIKDDTTLVAVTKNRSLDEIQNIYDQGVRNFGENRIEELISKVEHFDGVKWHFIGRIQSKKLPKIVQNASLIHSISSIEHLEKCNKCAENINKVQDILLQINISQEETKDGFMVEDIARAINLANSLSNINLKGIMVMGDHVDDENQIRKTFNKAFMIQQKYDLEILSMGMSDDYMLAIACGSNMIRVGSILFN